MKCGRRAVLVALALTGCGLDPTVSAPSSTAADPPPDPIQPPEIEHAAVAVAALAGVIAAGRAVPDGPTGYGSWADGAAAALADVSGRLAAADPVAGGDPVFPQPQPSPSAPPGTFAELSPMLAAASLSAEGTLSAATLAAGEQPLRLLLASAACTARSLARVGQAPVDTGGSPRHFQGTTVAASLPIALSHVWALIYGLGVGLGRLDGDDPLAALGADRLASARELRNELRDALPGRAPTQPAAFELPTPMGTSDEIRAGWGALELSVLEGLGRLVAAGGPGLARWLQVMVEQTDDVLAMGRPLTLWPGWV